MKKNILVTRIYSIIIIYNSCNRSWSECYRSPENKFLRVELAILESKNRRRTGRTNCSAASHVLNSMELPIKLLLSSLKTRVQQCINYKIFFSRKLYNWLNEILLPWFLSFILCSKSYWGVYLRYRIFLQRTYKSHSIMNSKEQQIKPSKSFQLSIPTML